MAAGGCRLCLEADGCTQFYWVSEQQGFHTGLHWCDIEVEELQEFHTVAEGFHRVREYCRGL